MAEMISAYNLLLQDRDRLREALKRLNDWALTEQGDFMCSADHPIARAEAVLSSSWGWSRLDARLVEYNETLAKFEAAKVRPAPRIVAWFNPANPNAVINAAQYPHVLPKNKAGYLPCIVAPDGMAAAPREQA